MREYPNDEPGDRTTRAIITLLLVMGAMAAVLVAIWGPESWRRDRVTHCRVVEGALTCADVEPTCPSCGPAVRDPTGNTPPPVTQ